MDIKEKNEFIIWHENRMKELNYSDAIKIELRKRRIIFLKYSGG